MDQAILLETLRRLRLDQRNRWLSGKPRRVEDYLAKYGKFLEDRAVLIEFIYTEFCLREEIGESPSLDEYARRFPEHATEIWARFEIDDAHAGKPPFPPQVANPVPLSEQPTVLPSEGDSKHGPSPTVTITQMRPPQPRQIGDYEILNEIARGGMGVVYKAKQLGVDRIVALKMVIAGGGASEKERARFRAEAEAAGQLDHPNIVPVFHVGEHDGNAYLVMGYVDGRSLKERITEGPLSARGAAKTVRLIAMAVQYAHDRGIIHRDLKPHNVLIDRRGQPRVTDFGLAKRIEGDSGLTATGEVLGTPSYMPPEQAGGKVKELTVAADVYALGATLYALLTGRPPFLGTTAPETILQVINNEPVPPRNLQPNVPREIEIICLKCLEKDPSQRYATARDLADDLARFLKHEPILARPVGRAEAAFRWCRRNPVVAGLSTAVGILLMLSVSLMIRSNGVGRDAGGPPTGTTLAVQPPSRPIGPSSDVSLAKSAVKLAKPVQSPSQPPANQPPSRAATDRSIASTGAAVTVPTHTPVKENHSPGGPSDGPGLNAEYFRGEHFERGVLRRVDKTIDFMWMDEAPDILVANDHFSVRWDGWIKAPEPGEYTFALIVDDGAKLWLDDRLIIDEWKPAPVRHREASVRMDEKPHHIRIEYYEIGLSAIVSLRWSLKDRFDELPIGGEFLFTSKSAAESARITRPWLEKGHGLRAVFYSDRSMTQVLNTRVIPHVDWWCHQLLTNGAVRIFGILEPPRAGTYRFHLCWRGGIRLRLADEQFDAWTPGDKDHQFEVELSAKKQLIQIDYFPDEHEQILSLRWTRPGGDPSVTEMIPPQAWKPGDQASELSVSIARGRLYLAGRQQADGSFAQSDNSRMFKTGTTSLGLLALNSSGLKNDDPIFTKGLNHLRSADEPSATYEAALMLMALVAAKDPDRDRARITSLTRKLENMQTTRGPLSGMWNYGRRLGGTEDNSNTQYAILGLHGAAKGSLHVTRKTWELAAEHFVKTQNDDGGWGYHNHEQSTGSMTSAGISSLILCQEILTSQKSGKQIAGVSDALDRGMRWMDRKFQVDNPGHSGSWILSYLCGVERAGLLSAHRTFGQHDWLQEGSNYLRNRQSEDGSWRANGVESEGIGTSFALLFLTKGLASDIALLEPARPSIRPSATETPPAPLSRSPAVKEPDAKDLNRVEPEGMQGHTAKRLAEKGIRVGGSGLSLIDETELSRSFDEANKLNRKRFSADKELQTAERDIEELQSNLRQRLQNNLALNSQLANLPRDNVVEHNQLVGTMNANSGQIKLLDQELEQYKKQIDVVRKKADAAREGYLQQVAEIRKLVDRLSKRYTVLQADPDAQRALAEWNSTANTKLQIKPSSSFLNNVKKLELVEKTVVSAKIPLRREGNSYFATVVINGKAPREMIVDTGANSVVLPYDVAIGCGVKPDESKATVVATVADGSKVKSKVVQLDSVRVGKFTVEHVECIVLPPEAKNAPTLLGMTFLSRFNFSINGTDLVISKIESKGSETNHKKGRAAKSTRKTRRTDGPTEPSD